MRALGVVVAVSASVWLSGCDCGNTLPDAGVDAGSDDAAIDAGRDAGLDAGSADAGVDAGAGDAGGDAGVLPCVMTCAGVVPPVTTLPDAGLVLWLRADVGVNSSPSTQRVCGWCDLSGKANDLTPRDPALETTWVPAAAGGLPGVRWSGVQVLQRSGVLGLAPTSARTVVVVVTLDDRSVRSAPFYQGQLGSLGEWWGIDPNVYQTVGNRFGVYLTANSFDTATATDVLAHVHVMTIDTMAVGAVIADVMRYHLDGTLQTLSATAGNGLIASLADANVTELGAGVPAAMTISEVLVFDRALTTQERQTVELLLKTRYGL